MTTTWTRSRPSRAIAHFKIGASSFMVTYAPDSPTKRFNLHRAGTFTGVILFRIFAVMTWK